MKFLLVLIILLAATLRLYKLDAFPPSLYWDEVSNGYNAYSVLKTARDEYGVLLPTVFRSYGDYKTPVYIYALIPSITLFNLDEFAVRFPSAASGIFTVILTYFLTLKITNNRKTAVFATFLLAIAPWHLHFSRGGFEANLMQSLTVLAIVLFLYSAKRWQMLGLSALSFGLAFNTYQGAKVWIPLVILTLFIIYRQEILSNSRKLILPLIILLLSIVPTLINFENSFLRGKSVSIFSQKDKNPFELFANGYLSHYSPAFLFASGDPIGRHSVGGMGQLYVFQLPLLLLGFFMLFKMHTKAAKLLLIWFLIAPIPASLSVPAPHALRSLTFVPVWEVISALGLFQLLKWKNKKAVKTFVIVIFLIGFYNFLLYLHLYYIHYPNEKGPDWQDGYKGALTYISSIYNKYDRVIISDALGKPYMNTLFYLKYDPTSYQQEIRKDSSFGKFEFHQDPWEKVPKGQNLFITSPHQDYPPHVLKEIYGRNGDLVFRISESQ